MLQGGKPFVYPYATSRVPVLFSPADWTQANPRGTRGGNDLLNALLDDPVLARLYWAMARMDGETATPFDSSRIPAPVSVLPGTRFLWQSHFDSARAVVVPGGVVAEPAWKSLAGADLGLPGTCRPLAGKDDWLAAYFDTLSRLTPARRVYFADSHRLPRFYDALRGKDINPGAHTGTMLDLILAVAARREAEFDSCQGGASRPGNSNFFFFFFFFFLHSTRFQFSYCTAAPRPVRTSVPTDDGPG